MALILCNSVTGGCGRSGPQSADRVAIHEVGPRRTRRGRFPAEGERRARAVPSCEPSRPVPATVRTPEHTQIRTDRLSCVGCEPRILPCAAEVVLERTRRYLLDVHRVESDGFVPAPDALIPGSRIVRLSGLDHAALALPWWSGTPVNPAPIVRALVVLAAGSMRHHDVSQALFFPARPLRGIRAPFLRALFRPMAIACLRDLTRCLPERMWCISVRTERLPFAELFERRGMGDLLSLENHHGLLGWQT